MKVYIVSRDEKPIMQEMDIKGSGINLRIVDSEKKYDYFIGDDGKLKKIRNKKTSNIIDVLIESMKGDKL